MFTLRRKRAFTLIELLIVITIIGILAVALVPRLTGGPAKARDAKRKGDLQQIATALEFYADDNGGVYPPATTGNCASGLSLSSYLTIAPVDPSGLGVGSCTTGYYYTPIVISGRRTGYALQAKLESLTATGPGVYDSFTISATTSYQSQISGKTTCTGSCTNPVYIIGR